MLKEYCTALVVVFMVHTATKICGFLLRLTADRNDLPRKIVSRLYNDFIDHLIYDSCLFMIPLCMSLTVNSLFCFRFLETGCRSDFNKIRMKLSEMGSVQLQNLVRKSRQLRDSIQQDVMKEDCVYVSDYEDRNLMNFFGSDPFSEYGRRIEVVTLD